MKMKRTFWAQAILSVFALFLFFGCAEKSPVNLPAFSKADFGNDHESKIDNFMIILDASSSMLEASPQGGDKFTVAKAVAERLNMNIPELGQTAGLRSFGHDKDVADNFVQLVYGMETYKTAVMAEKLDSITSAGGISLLKKSLVNTIEDLKGCEASRTAVIIISDGLDMDNAVQGAKALKDAFGDTLCLYPIQIGDSAEGKALLEEIAQIGECGFYSDANSLLPSEGMEEFVKAVFLKEKEQAAPVVSPSAKNDSDQDGVYDEDDKCPDTPKGARVNAVGCWILDHVLFGFDKADIRTEAYSQLDDVIRIMQENPEMKVELQGYTDSTGSAIYNKKLSLRRANAVFNYLSGNGIDKERMAATGFGEENPVVPNDTKENRAQNRRVEIQPIVVMP